MAGKAFNQDRPRLLNFIRQRVPVSIDAEDVVQDVFESLINAYALPEPIENVGAWLFRVATNKITDSFRKKKELPFPVFMDEDGDGDNEGSWLEQVLPESDSTPEGEYLRSEILFAVQRALSELPIEQQEAFIANELDGVSFKEMSANTGISMSTLLARKRYATEFLRQRLKGNYDDLYI